MENVKTKELGKRYELENKGLRRGAYVILKNDHPIIEENPNLEKYLGKVVVIERLGFDFFVCYVKNENNTLEFLNATLPYTLIDKVIDVDIDLTVAECNGLLGLLGKTVLLKSNGEKFIVGAVDLGEDYNLTNIVLVKHEDLFAIDSIDSNWDNFRDYYNYEISKGRMVVLEGLTFSEYDWYTKEKIEEVVDENNQTKEEEIENEKEESGIMYKVVIKRNEEKVDVVIKVKEEELHQFLVSLVDRYNNSKDGDMILVRDNIIFSNEVVSVDVIKEY